MIIMHEIKIARDLVSIILEVAEESKLDVINTVNVTFGKMIQVVPDIFEFAFRECVRDTMASDAELHIEILPVRARCTDCLKEFDPGDSEFICIYCGSPNLEISQGREMFVKSIEGE
jgi:hydrogenase nickel incorporation protein HypA/HybF